MNKVPGACAPFGKTGQCPLARDAFWYRPLFTGVIDPVLVLSLLILTLSMILTIAVQQHQQQESLSVLMMLEAYVTAQD